MQPLHSVRCSNALEVHLLWILMSRQSQRAVSKTVTQYMSWRSESLFLCTNMIGEPNVSQKQNSSLF